MLLPLVFHCITLRFGWYKMPKALSPPYVYIQVHEELHKIKNKNIANAGWLQNKKHYLLWYKPISEQADHMIVSNRRRPWRSETP